MRNHRRHTIVTLFAILALGAGALLATAVVAAIDEHYRQRKHNRHQHDTYWADNANRKHQRRNRGH